MIQRITIPVIAQIQKNTTFARMKNSKKIKVASLLLLHFVSIHAFSQDTIDNNVNDVNLGNKRKFHFGLYLGVLFANQSTAPLYDGYGFDIDGNKNNWDNSFMNQKINIQYGGYGYSGQTDQIAQELKVDPGTWTFSQDNMPINMRYMPAFNVGLSGRYSVDNKNAILFNVNASKLTIAGNFNIRTPQSQTGSSTQINNSLQTFAIKGGELRLAIQVGYQHLFGEGEKFNFLIEGGLNGTLAKFNQNQILINNLTIDLTAYNNSALLPSTVPFKNPIGIGFGGFTGLGVHANMNPKTIIQLVYSPTFEKINLGKEPRPQIKLQNSIGLRFFYNL